MTHVPQAEASIFIIRASRHVACWWPLLKRDPEVRVPL